MATAKAKRAWNLANREKVRAHKKAYYLRHRHRILAEQKAKREADKLSFYARRKRSYEIRGEHVRALMRAKYAADPEYAQRLLARNREYRAARLEEWRARDKEYQKAYQQKNPQRFFAKLHRANSKRRARKRDAFVEAVDPMTVFRRDQGVCGICRLSVDPQSHWHIDHVIPLSKGGLHSYANVQLAHARCNLSKQATVPEIPVLGGTP